MYQPESPFRPLDTVKALAVAYAEGLGVAKSPSESVRWFARAAGFGYVDAQFNLAVLYERGLGVPQSLLDAYKWYAIAAARGWHEMGATALHVVDLDAARTGGLINFALVAAFPSPE